MIRGYGIEQDSAVSPGGDFGGGVEGFGATRRGGVGASTEDGKWGRHLTGPGDGGDLVPRDLASLKPRTIGRQRLGHGERIRRD